MVNRVILTTRGGGRQDTQNLLRRDAIGITADRLLDRHDLALDIISNITGREAIRLRSDIYWASRRRREASEQIELYYADRWRDFKPAEKPGGLDQHGNSRQLHFIEKRFPGERLTVGLVKMFIL